MHTRLKLFQYTLSAVISALLLPTLLHAQAAPTNEEEEIITLSPFTITSGDDVGYRAVNAVSVTRIDTPIMDLPFNIAVVTSELMEDLNAGYSTDAIARYSAGIVSGGIDEGGLRIRGNNARTGMRNGFRADVNTPSALADRVELIKGPAAVLYGITYPGGSFNVVTKVARPEKDAYKFRGWVDNNSGYSLEADVNFGEIFAGEGSDPSKFAVRFVGLTRNGGSVPLSAQSVDPHLFENLVDSIYNQLLAGMVTFRPFSSTEIRYEYAYNEFERPGGGGLLRADIDLEGNKSAKSVRAEVPAQYLPTHMQVDDVPFDYALRVLPGNTFSTTTHSVFIDQRVGDNLNLKFGYFDAVWNRDDGAPEPRFKSGAGSKLPPDVAEEYGNPADAIRFAHRGRNTVGNNTDLLFVGSYEFDFDDRGIGNTITVAYQDVSNRKERTERWARDSEGDKLYAYWPVARYDYPSLASDQGIPGLEDWTPSPGVLLSDRQWWSLSATYQGEFFDKKLFTTLGITRLQLDQFTQSTVGYPEPKTDPGIKYDTGKDSPMVGVLYRPVPGLSFFASYAESIFPEPRLDGFDRSLLPPVGEGIEVGVKVDMWESKLVGTFSIYKINNVNQIIKDKSAPNSDTHILLPDGTIVPHPDPVDTGGAWANVGRSVLRGFEADFVYQPIPAWQTILSYAYQDHYIAEHVDPIRIGDPPEMRIPTHAVSLWSQYRFLEGTLKGLSVNLGLKWDGPRGDRIVGGSGDIPRVLREHKQKLYESELRISYTHRIGSDERYRLTYALNVTNLFDQGIERGWKSTDNTVAATENYFLPSFGRIFTLSTELEF